MEWGSLKGAGLEWGQERVGTEGRQDKGDIRGAKPSSPDRSHRVDAKHPSCGPNQDTPGQHWPVNGHYPMTQSELSSPLKCKCMQRKCLRLAQTSSARNLEQSRAEEGPERVPRE